MRRHLKQGRARQAGMLKSEAPLHVSNVMIWCANDDGPGRVGFRENAEGKKERYCKKCDAALPKPAAPARKGRKTDVGGREEPGHDGPAAPALSRRGRAGADERVRLQQSDAGAEARKSVVNVGLGEAVQNAKAIDAAIGDIQAITGQKPIVTAPSARLRPSTADGMPSGSR